MLSYRYTFKSNEFKFSYINGSIDHQGYISSLEDIKKEELASVVFDFKQREMEEEIFAFESQQLNEANQEISDRKKNAAASLLQAEMEKTKLLKATGKPKEEEKNVQPQTLEGKILLARTDFYENETPTIINGYKNEARKHRRTHDRLQVAIIIGSALATSTTGATIFTGETTISIVLKIIAALFSLVVTIASGSIAYFKYKERSNDTQKTADTIENDYDALRLGTGIYNGKPIEESLSMFAENINKTISEHKKKQQLLDQPPDKSGQAVQ